MRPIYNSTRVATQEVLHLRDSAGYRRAMVIRHPQLSLEEWTKWKEFLRLAPEIYDTMVAMLNDQESLQEPARNEALCERARRLYHQIAFDGDLASEPEDG